MLSRIAPNLNQNCDHLRTMHGRTGLPRHRENYWWAFSQYSNVGPLPVICGAGGGGSRILPCLKQVTWVWRLKELSARK